MEQNNKYELVKFIDNELELEVNVSPKEETIWMTQMQIAQLFNTSKQNVSLHINNIFKEGELNKNSVVKDFFTTASDGKNYKIKYYNLDVVISIGYRVKSIRGVIFRKWANKVLRDYLIKGYVINENRVLVSNENYIKLSNEVASINNRVDKLEDKVFNKEHNLDKILFNGQFYDAYTLIQSIFEKANNEIIIIDNYIDRTILDRLIVKKSNVNVIIYTNIKTSKILQNDINTFNKQYGLLKIINTNKVHDRYIVIDKLELYHIGASIKNLGRKIFSIIESDSKLIVELLKNIQNIKK